MSSAWDPHPRDIEIYHQVKKKLEDQRIQDEAPYRARSGEYHDEIMAIAKAAVLCDLPEREAYYAIRAYVGRKDPSVDRLNAHFAGAAEPHPDIESEMKNAIHRDLMDEGPLAVLGGLCVQRFTVSDPEKFDDRVAWWTRQIRENNYKDQKPPVSFGL